MSKRRRLTALTCLLALILVCTGVLAAGYGLYELQERVTRIFGPPAPRLKLDQRARLSIRLLLQSNELTIPVDRFGDQRNFQISWGENLPVIAGRLQAEGLIHDADAFRTYLQYAGLDTTLQAGNYQLSPALTPMQIAQALQDATPSEVTLTVLEGWRLEEIAATLPTSGLEITPQEFLVAAKVVPEGYEFLEEVTPTSLEGFLFPGTYILPRETTAQSLLTVLLDNFEAQLSRELQAGFNQNNLTVFEAVTLASIVERESIVDEEMPLIASVFVNRLGSNIKLEADSTVQYAIGYNARQDTWWTNPLSSLDLEVDSPFNTYRYSGLPPGPIANPGISALRAVAFPAQTPYYYFRAACDGSGRHLFAQTFAEHVSNECPGDEE